MSKEPGTTILLVFLLLPRLAAAEAATSGQGRPFSLRDCIGAALNNNLQIAIEGMNVKAAKEEVKVQQGGFDHLLDASTVYTRSAQPLSFDPENPYKIDAVTFSAGASKRLIFGTKLRLSFEDTYLKAPPIMSVGNLSLGGAEVFQPQLRLTLSQPLLRGFGSDVNTAPVNAASEAVSLTRLSEKRTVSQVLLAVERAYWSLVYAEQDLEIRRLARKLAEEQLEVTSARVEQGELPDVALIEVRQTIAVRGEAVMVAEDAARQIEKTLLDLMNVEGGSPDGIAPTDLLETTVDGRIDADAAVRDAVAGSYELRMMEQDLKVREVTLVMLGNAVYPQLDLVGSLGMIGAHKRFEDALGQVGKLDSPSWSVGLLFSLPIENTSAESSLEKKRIESARKLVEMKAFEKELASRVQRLVEDIDSSRRRIDITEMAVNLAGKALDIEQEKFRQGVSLPTDVLDLQEKVKEARLHHLRAVLDYVTQSADLDHLRGRLLEKWGISVGEKKM